MPWLVDGMNVIGARPDGWWRDRPAAMRRLVDELRAHSRASGDGLTVVFDGEPFDLPGGDGVEVRFAPRRGRDAADDEIARLVARSDEPGSLRVATSDAGLAARVEAGGARVVGAGEFRRLARLG